MCVAGGGSHMSILSIALLRNYHHKKTDPLRLTMSSNENKKLIEVNIYT